MAEKAAQSEVQAAPTDSTSEIILDGLDNARNPLIERLRGHLALALHAQREVIHHGSEIALLRDLYAAR